MDASAPRGVARLAAACASLGADDDAGVDAAAAARLGSSVPLAEASAAVTRAPGVRFPVNFPTLEAEVNFIALLALLGFGSGWDAELRATGERRRPAGDGAVDLALRGLFSLHISGCVRHRCLSFKLKKRRRLNPGCCRRSKLDASALCALSEHDVAQAWGLPLTRDVPVAGCTAMTVAQDSEVRPFLRSLRFTLADTGRRLWERQAASLGAFVLALATPESTSAAGGPTCGAALADSLAEALPAFADDAPWGEKTTLPFRAKALRLVGDLHRRFRRAPPAADEKLSVFA
jgi:hypothetical protein